MATDAAASVRVVFVLMRHAFTRAPSVSVMKVSVRMKWLGAMLLCLHHAT
jgi:hypothetical protein